MKMNSNIKPALWGAVGGAVAIALVGFAWGGWKTASSASAMVDTGSQKAVVLALTPFCVEKFNAQADAVARLDELKKLPGYNQGSFVEKAGWATFEGDKPNSAVARACANAPISAASKSASAS